MITLAVSLVFVNHKIHAGIIWLAVMAVLLYPTVMVTHAQIRAARALIGWKQTDLAKAAGLSEMSIKNIERGNTDPRVSTIASIRAALEHAGIVFLAEGQCQDGGSGVRLTK